MHTNNILDFMNLWKDWSLYVNPNSKVSEGVMQSGFMLFKDYSFEEVSDAVVHVASTTKSPTLKFNEVLDYLKEKREGGTVDITEGYNAWQIVNSVVESLGIYRSYIFADPYIGMTLQALGWNLDYMNTLPDNEFNRNIFAKAYATQSKFDPRVVVWGNNDKHIKVIEALPGGIYRSYDLDKPEYLERIVENGEVNAVLEYAKLKFEEDNRFRLELEEEERRDRELHRNSKPLSKKKQEELFDMFFKALVGRIDNIPDIDK